MGFSLKKLTNKALGGSLTGFIPGGNSLFGGSTGANVLDPLDIFGNTARKYQAHQAEIDREWQERMSNTAHQREVADLEKAGINPVLTAQGGNGASTPSGSNVGQATGSGIDELVGLLNAFSQIKANKTSAKQAKSQADLNDKQIENLADEITQRGLRTAQDVRESEARTIKLLEEAKAEAKKNKINEDLGISNNETGTTRTGAWAIKGQQKAYKSGQAQLEVANMNIINRELTEKNEQKERELANSLKPYLKPYEMELFIKARKHNNMAYAHALMKRAKSRGYK